MCMCAIPSECGGVRVVSEPDEAEVRVASQVIMIGGPAELHALQAPDPDVPSGSKLRPMSLSWAAVVVDSVEPAKLGRWWAAALDWEIDSDDAFGVEIRPRGAASGPALVFVPGPVKAVTKNRLHLDFQGPDQKAEVDRLIKLGAARADIGQGDVPWVVLSDPEGNEFCVLEPRG
jgi:hypothetical protein